MSAAVFNGSYTHIAFADESRHNKGKFRSVAVVSLNKDHKTKICDQLKEALSSSQIDEFKWYHVTSAKHRFAAIKAIKIAVEYALNGIMRVDVLRWDTHDARHNVSNRDDVENLHRMYHHLLKAMLGSRWPNARWLIHPDENTAMAWKSVHDFANAKGTITVVKNNLFTPTQTMELIQKFCIEDIVALRSCDELLIQLADLFAGLSVFSSESYEKFDEWRDQERTIAQPRLFELEKGSVISASVRERCVVLHELNSLCKTNKLGVSLDTYKGLRTPDPCNPLNFWFYVPQHSLDTAPTKQ